MLLRVLLLLLLSGRLLLHYSLVGLPAVIMLCDAAAAFLCFRCQCAECLCIQCCGQKVTCWDVLQMCGALTGLGWWLALIGTAGPNSWLGGPTVLTGWLSSIAQVRTSSDAFCLLIIFVFLLLLFM